MGVFLQWHYVVNLVFGLQSAITPLMLSCYWTTCSLLCESMWIISSKWTVPGSSLLNFLLFLVSVFLTCQYNFSSPVTSNAYFCSLPVQLHLETVTGSCLVPLSKLLMEIWITSECNRNPSQCWHIQKQFWLWEDNCCVRCWTRYIFHYLLPGTLIFFNSLVIPVVQGWQSLVQKLLRQCLFEQISSSQHQIWGYHFCAVLQRSHFWLHLHFGLPLKTCPPCKPSPVRNVIPREQQHCSCLGLAFWNPSLGSGGTLHEGSNVVLQFLRLFW